MCCGWVGGWGGGVALSLCMLPSCMMLTSLPSFFSLEAVNKNRKIILVALYFLIWGEAANVRFLPECICYIFHNVSQCLIKCWSSLFFFPSKKSTGSSLHFTIEEETSRVV